MFHSDVVKVDLDVAVLYMCLARVASVLFVCHRKREISMFQTT
jgi:hypothetical protein